MKREPLVADVLFEGISTNTSQQSEAERHEYGRTENASAGMEGDHWCFEGERFRGVEDCSIVVCL